MVYGLFGEIQEKPINHKPYTINHKPLSVKSRNNKQFFPRKIIHLFILLLERMYMYPVDGIASDKIWTVAKNIFKKFPVQIVRMRLTPHMMKSFLIFLPEGSTSIRTKSNKITAVPQK